jgi:hypothetical protein
MLLIRKEKKETWIRRVGSYDITKVMDMQEVNKSLMYGYETMVPLK